ncbi:DUF2523 family protein [Burkholderia pseudomallei]|uniref:DUF2523 family protein n=1 Tax=Burkholderia pseudomallei TaxID=28450 RepID=UPI00053804FF|nr:DUF2523 family protein [Burkholderia pseudomallei]KGW49888.1 putative membrane protein [Burkholderia pseudomallei MSHR684]OMW20872.1 hypothetical protein AQ806_12440 [Burkholderia pseudomallei]
MYPILMSAVWSALSWLFRSVLIKFVFYFALYFFVTEAASYLQGQGILPTVASLSQAFGAVGSGVWYFLDLCSVSYGMPLVIAAYGARFIIRRIPLIG